MSAVLDLDPAWIIRSGAKVIAQRVESDRARAAYSRKRIRECRAGRAVFG